MSCIVNGGMTVLAQVITDVDFVGVPAVTHVVYTAVSGWMVCCLSGILRFR